MRSGLEMALDHVDQPLRVVEVVFVVVHVGRLRFAGVGSSVIRVVSDVVSADVRLDTCGSSSVMFGSRCADWIDILRRVILHRFC